MGVKHSDLWEIVMRTSNEIFGNIKLPPKGMSDLEYRLAEKIRASNYYRIKKELKMNKRTNPRFALEALKDVSKKLGMKKVRDDVYNLGTFTEQKAAVFVLPLEAVVMNCEWDNLNEEQLIKLLRIRFMSYLDFIFIKEQSE